MSFKKYGGTYNTERGSTISYGTIIADRVMIRERTATSAVVEASLTVKGDIFCESTLNVDTNSFLGTTPSHYVTTYNTHVKEKLFFNDGAYDNTNTSYITGTGSLFGIGTETPQSFFDINTDLSNAFAVRSSTQGTLRNILTQNILSSGVAVNTSGNNSTLGFFVADINASSPNEKAYIRYSDSSNKVILSGGNGDIDISANVLNLNVDTTIFNSQNTNFSSNMAISNRGGLSQLYNETLTIYDNSTNLYNSEQYPTSSVNSGNAATFITSDNNSNTRINIVTPNKKGVSFTGGAHMNDNNNSIAIFQLEPDDSNSHIPTQMMISNNNEDIHRTTTGFNTYNPRSGSHTLDINGPIRICNGDVVKRYSNTFHINDIMVSKTNPNHISIIGSAEIYDTITNNYIIHFYNSTDKGKNWSREQVYSSLNNTTFSLFVTNDISSFISENGIYTNNGTIPRIFTFSTDNDTYRFVKTYMVSYTDANFNTDYGILVAKTKTNIGSGMPQIYYTTQNSSGTPTNFITATIDSISDMDGINNTIFAVGDGIEKFTYSPSNAPVSNGNTKLSNTYQKIRVFSSSIVVTSGNNIISYTTDGGANWNDSVIISSTSGDTTSIDLFDETSGIIVYTNGLLLYSFDGFVTWREVDTNIFKSSGSSYLDTPSKIKHVIMTSKKEFLFTTIESTFIDENNTGKTNVLYGFYPSIFEEHNNIILDISGSINTSGLVYQF